MRTTPIGTLRTRAFRGVGLALFLLLTAFVDVRAQLSGEGSVYSAFGVGERKIMYSSQSRSMATIGTAFFSPAYLNLANPATWSDQVFARFGAGLDIDGVRAEDAAGNTSEMSRGSLGSLYFGFPLRRRALGVAFSFAPYTNVGYRVVSSGQLPADGSEPGTTYNVNHEGAGGLHELAAGFGIKVYEGLSFGLSGSIVFGRIETGERTTFDNTDAFLPEVNTVTSTRLSGFTASAGAAYKMPSVLGESDALTLGLVLTLPATLNANRTQVVRQNRALEDTVGVTTKGDVTVPLRVQVGLTYAPSSKWLIAIDAMVEPWSRFDSDLGFAGFTPGAGDTFNDRKRLGGGVQFVPAGSRPLQPFLQRIAYRLGTYVDRSHVRPLTADKLTTYGVSGGFGIPSLIPGTYVDLNGEVAFRGRTDDFLVRDLLYRVTVTINFGERWFVKRKLG